MPSEVAHFIGLGYYGSVGRPFNTNTHPGVTHKSEREPTTEPKCDARGPDPKLEVLIRAIRPLQQKSISQQKSIRQQVLERDRTCRHCDTHEDLTIDHIVPLSRGGCRCPENLQALCSRCNVHKGNGGDYKGAVGHRKHDCPRDRKAARPPPKKKDAG